MVKSMQFNPPGSSALLHELYSWIRCERDAAWATKLAILRVERREDIAHFGACLHEHDRHAAELGQLLRTAVPSSELPCEPSFVTREPFVIGALSEGEAVVAAMRDLEASRVGRYDSRTRRGQDEPLRMLDALLERHAANARRRLAWLTGRCLLQGIRRTSAA
jgi:hypothetical protein